VPGAEEIDVTTAHAMARSGDVIVDVRLPEEYASGHVAGAVNIPLRELPVRIDELPEGPIVTVCSMGNRSPKGAHTLARFGRTAFSVRGGTKACAAAGLPVVTGPEPDRVRRRTSLWRWFKR
jgi:rhodanese-related sulfurtransferase